jgi:hypothetical protein
MNSMMNEFQAQPRVRGGYTRALASDMRWRGPYLAVAFLLGVHADRDGKSWSLRAKTLLSPASGLDSKSVELVIRALVEQKYIELLTPPRTSATPAPRPYRLLGNRPTLELDMLTNGEIEWDEISGGPASDELAEATRRWVEFTKAERQAARDDDDPDWTLVDGENAA